MALVIDDLHVTKQGRVYQVQITFDVAASVHQVMAVLTDYGFPDRMNPKVTSKIVISHQGGITRVRVEIRNCVIFFCKNVTLTQDVTVVADTIQVDVVADQSDFRSGYFHWRVTRSDNGGSHIAFESVMEPDFFIPPIIGGFIVRKRLRKEILAAAKNLERAAILEPAPAMDRN
jgi:hypothetical protein